MRTIGAGRLDPDTRPCGVDTDLKRSESELLAEAAMALLGCRSEQAVFDTTSAFLGQLCPGSIVVVNELSHDREHLVTRSVAGVNVGVLAQASRLLGFEVVGLRSAIVPEFRDSLLRGTLWAVPGGFVELASVVVPRSVARACSEIFGLHDALMIGIADGERVLGNVQIFTREPNAVVPSHTIESFLPQCFSAISAIRSGRELATSVSHGEFIARNIAESLVRLEAIRDVNGRPTDYRFLEVNPAFESMVGLTAEEVLGRTTSEVLPEFEAHWVEGFASVTTTGAPARLEGYSAFLDRHLQVLAYAPQPGQVVAVGFDVTDHKRAEEALAASEERFRTALSASPVPMALIDEKQNVTFVNDALRRALGYSTDNVPTLAHWWQQAYPDSEYRAKIAQVWEAELERVARTGDVFTPTEARVRCADGTNRIMLISAAPLENGAGGLIVSMYDVTDSKRAQHELEISEAKFATAFRASPDALNINRLADGQYIEINEGFTEITGFTAEDVAGKTSIDLGIWANPADRERLVEGLLSAGTVHNLEAQFRCRDGHIITGLMSAHLVELAGEPCVLSVTRDITESKRLDEALQQRLMALTQPIDVAGGLTFHDLFDVEEIQAVQDAFSAATGVASVITTPDGTPITRPSNYRRLCSEVIRSTDRGLVNCRASDVELGRTGHAAPVVQRCLSGGLWDAGTAITAGGEHVANWFIGQVLDEDANTEQMLLYANEIGADPEEYREALAEVPVMEIDQFQQVALSMHLIASRLSVIAYQNVQQARFITESARAKEELAREQELGLQRLRNALSSVVEIVSQVTETRDPYTAGHQRRVAELAVRIAQTLGMSPQDVEEIRIAALVHDVGKIGVPAEILTKPSRLSDVEFDIIKGHSEAGYKIITSARLEGPIAEIVLQHHERCDGSGYPHGLTFEELLPAARVLMVADVVEAMVLHRPYRPGLGQEAALAEIEAGAGRLFDADVAAACLEVFRTQGFAFALDGPDV